MRGGQENTVARHYRIKTVQAIFEAAGFKDVQMREFRVTSNGDPSAFSVGRHEAAGAGHRRSYPHGLPS